MPLPLPQPPYPLRAGMKWDLDGNFVHIFDGSQPVMTISISEITGEAAKVRAARPSPPREKQP